MSILFSAVATSIFFSLLHAQQIGRLVPVLIVLFCVSLVLTFVRIKLRSVACSTLVHASYNSFVFLMVLFQTGAYRHLDKLHK
jgi:membrane protease YdiL (CAAX protease family)